MRAMRGGRRAIPDNGVVQDSTEPAPPSAVLSHGGRVLPAVTVDTYNEELRDEDGFVGDRASGRAFRAILEDWRDKLRAAGRGSVRRHADPRDLQVQARQGAGRARSAGGRPGPHRGRGICRRARDRGAPLPAPEELAWHRAHRDRRRLECQPHRRAGDGPRRACCWPAKASRSSCARSPTIPTRPA